MELAARSFTLHTATPFETSRSRRASPPGALAALARRARRSPIARRAARLIGAAVGGTAVVQVELRADGHVARGEGTPLHRYGESAASALAFLAEAARMLAGMPANDCFDRGESAALFEALPPGEFAARAALDAALLDLEGRRAGVPVWQLLRLARTGPATSLTLSLDDPAAMARAAERAGTRFHSLKLKLGGGDGRDLERVRAVRRAVPLPILVDANEGWSIDEAFAILPHLAGLGVVLVEQPLRVGDAAAGRLRDASPLPIFIDEGCRAAGDIAACARIAHGVNIKLSKCGGVREALRCCAAAREHGLQTMIGCMIESTLGIAAAAHIASAFDYADLDGNLLLDRDPFTGIDLIDGVQLPGTAPGLGVLPAATR
jgi:L-Ala-D/L-Glu epimerase